MKISLKWINEFIDVSDFFSQPERLGEILTHAGLELEGLTNPGSALKNVVIGVILEKNQHPNADKLSLCRVSTGPDVVHQIVCGAKNHKAGDRVVVALPGAVLPGEFAIKKSQIRGVDSHGMLCSYKELGLAKDSEGIAILPVDAPLGESYAVYAGLEDVIFELKVTPNRADCLSHLGLAREISALLGRALKERPQTFKALGDFSTKGEIKVGVRDLKLCPRYTGRILRNVKVGPAPSFIKSRLEALGVNSINNVVDISNYVMMELGQPLHAFDLEKIQSSLEVDLSRPQEIFTTLSGEELQLTGEELCIRDSSRALCLAGTLGGKDSGVTEGTTSVFLESANFLASSVRKTSVRFGLNTDSAYRFSRGVDLESPLLALQRASELLQTFAAAQASEDYWDVRDQSPDRPWISISAQLIEDRLGYAVSRKEAVDLFKRLDFECKFSDTASERKEDPFLVRARGHRFDIETEMDLVEEYARVRGYDLIPETLPSFGAWPSPHDASFVSQIEWGQRLRALGYSEAWTFAFQSPEREKGFWGDSEASLFNSVFGWVPEAERVRVMNPLSEDQALMKMNLALPLLERVVHNLHRSQNRGRLFEIGFVFKNSAGHYQEKQNLALAIWGETSPLWKTGTPLVIEVKAHIEELLRGEGLGPFRWKTEGAAPPFVHGSQWACLEVRGQDLGWVGCLHPQVADKEKVRVPVVLAEIMWSSLLALRKRELKFKSISKFPVVEQDFTFVLQKDHKLDELMRLLERIAKEKLVQLEVVGFFEGGDLQQGSRAVTLRWRLQAPDSTLQEKDIAALHGEVLSQSEKKLGILIR